MNAIGIRQFKAQLSRCLRDVRQGEILLITDRGRVVAEVRPPNQNEATVTDLRQVRIQQMVRQGNLTPASNPDDRSWCSWPGVGLNSTEVTALIDADREEP